MHLLLCQRLFMYCWQFLAEFCPLLILVMVHWGRHLYFHNWLSVVCTGCKAPSIQAEFIVGLDIRAQWRDLVPLLFTLTFNAIYFLNDFVFSFNLLIKLRYWAEFFGIHNRNDILSESKETRVPLNCRDGTRVTRLNTLRKKRSKKKISVQTSVVICVVSYPPVRSPAVKSWPPSLI